MKPIEYEQTDRRWKNIMYSSVGDKRQTIGTSGCGTTCAAMVIATLRVPTITPKSTSDWAVKHGYRTANDGTSWAYFKALFDKYDIKCTQTDSVDTALSAIKVGKMVITTMGKSIWTSGGHFLLAYGMSNGKILIHDPNSEEQYKELAEVSNYRKGFRQAWIIEEEWNKPKEDDDMKYYERLQEVPDYARDVIADLIAKGIIKGGTKGLGLSEDNVKMFVWLKRMGIIK